MVGPSTKQDQPELNGACWPTAPEREAQMRESMKFERSSASSAAEQPAHPRVHGWHVPCRTPQGPLHTSRQLQSCTCTRHHLRNHGELHSHAMTLLDG